MNVDRFFWMFGLSLLAVVILSRFKRMDDWGPFDILLACGSGLLWPVLYPALIAYCIFLSWQRRRP